MDDHLRFEELFLYESSHTAVSRSLLVDGYPEHGHDFTEVVVAMKGEGIHTINGRDYPFGPGSVSVIKGRDRHGFTRCHDLELYNFIMYGEDMSLLLADLRTLPGYQYLFVVEPGRRDILPQSAPTTLLGSELEWTRDTAALMLREYQGAAPGFQAVVKGGFLQLAALICRSFGRPAAATSELMPQLGAALAYMEAHYLEPLEVGRLASISGLSTRQFQRLFRELRGTTPLGYITRLRLERGKALLRRSGLNVTEVALRTGFSDGNYFSRVFRARLGLSPSDYRHQTKR
jgi:AraC family transcriptional regulator, L-rhamnose operon regulatory protein RhaS